VHIYLRLVMVATSELSNGQLDTTTEVKLAW
jgi:hypothetical protein